MLSHMPRAVFNGLAALTVAIPVMAWSRLPVHHARAPSLSYFSESVPGQSTDYSSVNGTALFSWQETSLQGFGHIDAKAYSAKTGVTNSFELKMVRVTSSNATTINGEWDVFKNGTPTCAGCKGSVYLSAPGQNAYLKGYVNDGQVGYSFAADIDAGSRLDY